MKYNQLQVRKSDSKRRVGRGISGGQGKTAGRGTKGQGARTGHKLRPTFTGGQLPLVQAIPKSKGFKPHKVKAQVVYLDRLNTVKGETVDNMTLFDQGLIATPYQSVKVIARGELAVPLTLRVQAASESVKAALIKAGGAFEKTPVPLRAASAEKQGE